MRDKIIFIVACVVFILIILRVANNQQAKKEFVKDALETLKVTPDEELKDLRDTTVETINSLQGDSVQVEHRDKILIVRVKHVQPDTTEFMNYFLSRWRHHIEPSEFWTAMFSINGRVITTGIVYEKAEKKYLIGSLGTVEFVSALIMALIPIIVFLAIYFTLKKVFNIPKYKAVAITVAIIVILLIIMFK